MDKSKKKSVKIIVFALAFIVIFALLFVGLFSFWGIIQGKKKMNAVMLYPKWYEYVSPAFDNVEITKCQIKDNTIRVEYNNTAKGTFDDQLYLKLSEEFFNNNPNYFPTNPGIEVMEADPQPVKNYLSKIGRLKQIFN